MKIKVALAKNSVLDDRLKQAKAMGFDIKRVFVHVSVHELPQNLRDDKTLYVTENLEYARRFASNPSAAILMENDSELNPSSNPLYVKLSQIFDTRKAKDRALFYSKFFKKYGSSTELTKTGLPDWSDAEDFRDFFEDESLPYGGVFLDEGNDVDLSNGKAKHRGISIAIFDPTCVKSIFAQFKKDNNNILAHNKE